MVLDRCVERDDATARAFVAYYLHDITATATEQGDAELAHAVAVERLTWEERGLLTPIAARGVLAWALHRLLTVGQDYLAGATDRDTFDRALDDTATIEQWLHAHAWVGDGPGAHG
ncbi:hypothetical protein [Streptomyces erythrochromogenes]|uniref:hypothetical protein n=1 Tax=Streptomyces erythrochromogenes TaxID=285574 RepID=UPI00386A7314|nr:hypothetical protein OG364_35125 [Streptomyces erythrochromogenes]